MAMTVLIQLTIAGADTGPFDLYSNIDGYVSAFATGISKASLVAGYTSSSVPDNTAIIRVLSTEICTNYVDLPVLTTTTTSTSTTGVPTTTTTTTASGITLVYNNTKDCGGVGECDCDCIKSVGEILVNGIVAYNWYAGTVLPSTGTLVASAGDTIVINATAYISGVSCIETWNPVITINLNGALCATDDTGSEITCTFTFTATTVIEIVASCTSLPI